ncbi:MAG: NAD(P)/FAD-dependent oxidoreductase [Chthoniobacterales bacterium]
MIHDTIVIGAGLAGLAAAGRLQKAGQDVLVLEKSRGLGGRAATRRWDGLPVDHGAQFFTARSEDFRDQVARWQESGVCHPWAHGFHQHRNGRIEPPGDDGYPRFACRKGMSNLGRALAETESVAIERQTKVVSIQAAQDGWLLTDENGRTFHSRRLIVTAPPPQGVQLLQQAAPRAAELLQTFRANPCLAIAAKYLRRELPWHGIQSDSAEISWIGHDTSKRPDEHHGQTVVVVHASADFSRTRYDEAEEEITRMLLSHASAIAGQDLGAPAGTFLQRWRFATIEEAASAESAMAVEAPAPLILAGESFAGGKIEGAWLSGRHAADLAA